MTSLKVGQELQLRRDPEAKVVQQNLEVMRLTAPRGNPDPTIHVMFVDATGISVYIARGFEFGGDMKAYLRHSEVAWQKYFAPLNRRDENMKSNEHYKQRFPLDFL